MQANNATMSKKRQQLKSKEPYQFKILKVGQNIQKEEASQSFASTLQGRLSMVKGESDIPKPKAVGTPMPKRFENSAAKSYQTAQIAKDNNKDKDWAIIQQMDQANKNRNQEPIVLSQVVSSIGIQARSNGSNFQMIQQVPLVAKQPRHKESPSMMASIKQTSFDHSKTNLEIETYVDRNQHPHLFQSTLQFSPMNLMKFSKDKQHLLMSPQIGSSKQNSKPLNVSMHKVSNSMVGSSCKKARMPTQKIQISVERENNLKEDSIKTEDSDLMTDDSCTELNEITSLRSGPAFKQRHQHQRIKSGMQEEKLFKSAVKLKEDQRQSPIRTEHKMRLTEMPQMSATNGGGRLTMVPPSSEGRSLLQAKHVEDSDGSSIFCENVNVNKDGPMQWISRRFQRSELNEVISQNQDQYHQKTEEMLPQQQTLMLSPKNQSINLMLELNLRLSNIKDVDAEIFNQNKFIRSVDLRNNRINHLPDSICDLPSLWNLRLDYNYLKQLPRQIGFMKRLEYLTVGQNQLQSIPLTLHYLQGKLQVLHLNDNRIRELSLDFCSLNELKALLLHGNCIEKIPCQFYQLKQLNEFSIDWFIYYGQDRLINKIQKEETGQIIISEFMSFLQSFERVIYDQEANRQGQSNQIYVSFIHFLMFTNKLDQLNDLRKIEYVQKKRNLAHLMAINGHLSYFQEILSICPSLDINKQDEEDSTPFLLAIKNKKKDFIKHLMNLPQTNLSKGSAKHGYPLHIAILTHEFKLAINLLKNQQDKFGSYKFIDVNSKTEEGNNAMHLLVMNFSANPTLSKSVGKLLIKQGIGVNHRNSADFTPLHLAINNNQIEALEFILESNAYHRRKEKDSLSLFDFGLQGGRCGWNALHMAISNNNIRTIKILLESKEKLNFWDRDDEGRTPKDVSQFNSPIYKILVKREQDVQKQMAHFEGIQQLPNQPKFLNQPNMTHFFINKRFYESPRIIRKKILAAETIKKKTHTHRLSGMPIGDSLFHREAKSCRRPTAKTNKNYKILTKRSGGDESCYYTNHDIMSTLNNEDDNDYQYPPTHQRNLSQDSNYYGKVGPSRMLKDQQMNCQIKSNVSSPEESLCSSSMMRYSKMENHCHLKNMKRQSTTENRCQTKMISIINTIEEVKQEHNADMNLKVITTDGDDEANVPEDDEDAQKMDKNGLGEALSSPQIRIINKISNFYDKDHDKEKLIQSILYELSQHHRMRLASAIPISGVERNEETLCNLEQGNQVYDLSNTHMILEESVAIHIPQDDLRSPRMANNLIKSGNEYLRVRLADEIAINDHFQNFNSVVEMTTSKILLDFFISFAKKDIQQLKNQFIPLLSMNRFKNPIFVALLADLTYFFCNALEIKDTKEVLQLVDKNFQESRVLKVKPYSKRIKEFILYEIINVNQTKIYEYKKCLEMQIKLLDANKFSKKPTILSGRSSARDLTNVEYSNYQSNQKPTQIEKSPNLRVILKKSPSIMLNYQDTSSKGTPSKHTPQKKDKYPGATEPKKKLELPMSPDIQLKKTEAPSTDLRHSVKFQRGQIAKVQQPSGNQKESGIPKPKIGKSSYNSSLVDSHTRYQESVLCEYAPKPTNRKDSFNKTQKVGGSNGLKVTSKDMLGGTQKFINNSQAYKNAILRSSVSRDESKTKKKPSQSHYIKSPNQLGSTRPSNQYDSTITKENLKKRLEFMDSSCGATSSIPIQTRISSTSSRQKSNKSKLYNQKNLNGPLSQIQRSQKVKQLVNQAALIYATSRNVMTQRLHPGKTAASSMAEQSDKCVDARKVSMLGALKPDIPLAHKTAKKSSSRGYDLEKSEERSVAQRVMNALDRSCPSKNNTYSSSSRQHILKGNEIDMSCPKVPAGEQYLTTESNQPIETKQSQTTNALKKSFTYTNLFSNLPSKRGSFTQEMDFLSVKIPGQLKEDHVFGLKSQANMVKRSNQIMLREFLNADL